MIINREDGQRLSDQVVDHIANLIGSGQYAEGSKLPSERDLASSLGVSRPVVRECYRILQGVGVVEVQHGVGAMVARHSQKNAGIVTYLWKHSGQILEALEVRDSCSALCGELAAERITADELIALEVIHETHRGIAVTGTPVDKARLDHDFHNKIYRASRNQILLALEDYTMSILGNYRLFVLSMRSPEVSVEEHSHILVALMNRDPQAASTAMKSHISRTSAYIRQMLEMR